MFEIRIQSHRSETQISAVNGRAGPRISNNAAANTNASTLKFHVSRRARDDVAFSSEVQKGANTDKARARVDLAQLYMHSESGAPASKSKNKETHSTTSSALDELFKHRDGRKGLKTGSEEASLTKFVRNGGEATAASGAATLLASHSMTMENGVSDDYLLLKRKKSTFEEIPPNLIPNEATARKRKWLYQRALRLRTKAAERTRLDPSELKIRNQSVLLFWLLFGAFMMKGRVIADLAVAGIFILFWGVSDIKTSWKKSDGDTGVGEGVCKLLGGAVILWGVKLMSSQNYALAGTLVVMAGGLSVLTSLATRELPQGAWLNESIGCLLRLCQEALARRLTQAWRAILSWRDFLRSEIARGYDRWLEWLEGQWQEAEQWAAEDLRATFDATLEKVDARKSVLNVDLV